MVTRSRSFIRDLASKEYELEGYLVKTPIVQTITLSEFVRESWHVLEESTHLDWNWHIEAVCLHIEAIFFDWLNKKRGIIEEQRMQNLLINIPPGSMKSRIVSVCFPAWAWLYDPAWKAYFMAANPTVAVRDSLYCKEIITSDWYVDKFKPDWRLSPDHNTQKSFGNTKGGFRKAFGFTAKITGGRADALIVDDPHDADEVNSETKRLAVLNRWDLTISNRVNDLRSSIRIGIMQRLHENDWAGHVFESGVWVKLLIEQEYTGESEATPIGWSDPRKAIGALMFPTRFPESVLTVERDRLRSYGYSGQHQQRPSPSGGGMFPIGKWRLYIPSTENFQETILSMDASFKGGKQNDFVVIGAIRRQIDVIPPTSSPFGIYRRHRYYIPHRVRFQAGIIESQRELRSMAAMFPNARKKLIEDKANGSAIIQQMTAEMSGIEPINPGSDSKIARAESIRPIHDRGDLCIPVSDWAIANIKAMGVTSCTIEEYWAKYPPAHTSTSEHAPVADWAKELLDEAAKFPNAKHDDQVDMLSQGLIWLEANVVPIVVSAPAYWR
jgi:phage terminase large subunit-like protein